MGVRRENYFRLSPAGDLLSIQVSLTHSLKNDESERYDFVPFFRLFINSPLFRSIVLSFSVQMGEV